MCRTTNPCPPRYCQHCGGLIERTYGMSPWRYGRRRFCCHKCADAATGHAMKGRKLLPIPERTCKWPGCGAKLVQRPSETRGSFRARKCCSAECLRRYRADWLRQMHVLQRKVDPTEVEIERLKWQLRQEWYESEQMRQAVVNGTTVD